MMNPFLLRRDTLADDLRYMRDSLLMGRSQWPKPPPAAADEAATATEEAAAAAERDEEVLRAPCFYNMFPGTWRQRHARMNGKNVTSTPAGSMSVAAASESRGDDVAPRRSDEHAAMNPPAPAPLRLRARSPSRVLPLLGSASARALYAADFASALVERTPHVTGHQQTNGNGAAAGEANNPPPSPMPAGAIDAASVGLPSASVNRRRSRFNQPVSDMGEYIAPMRVSTRLLLRNPLTDPLDDPAFVAHLAHQHSAAQQAQAQAEAEAARVVAERTRAQAAAGAWAEETMGTGQAQSSTPTSPTSSPRRRASSPLDRSSPQSGTAPSQHRLTVDEADDLPEGAPIAGTNLSPVMRARRPGLSGGRRNARLARPSFASFLLARSSASPTTSAATRSPHNSSTSDAIDTTPPGTHSRSLRRAPAPDPKRVKREHALSAAASASASLKRDAAAGEPTFASLLASMMRQTRARAERDALARANGNGGADDVPPRSPAAVLLHLHRLECDLAAPPRVVRAQNAAARSVYLARVEAWFVSQVTSAAACDVGSAAGDDVVRLGRDALEKQFESAFRRWRHDLAQIMQNGSNATDAAEKGITIEWSKIIETARARAAAATPETA